MPTIQPTAQATERTRLPAHVRQAAIIDAISRFGSVFVSELSQNLAVSEMTIRRDLVELEREGKLMRTHGGAVRMEKGTAMAPADNFDADEPAFDARLVRNATQKRRIALAAAELATSARSIALDVGTTTYFLAETLALRPQMKIFTNSMRSGHHLAARGAETYIAGGKIRGEEMSTSGPSAMSQFEALWFDIAFVGVSGITDEGVFDYSFEEADMKRLYLARSSRRVVLCDSTKFNRMSLVHVVGLSEINTLICDEAPPETLRAALTAASVDIVVAR